MIATMGRSEVFRKTYGDFRTKQTYNKTTQSLGHQKYAIENLRQGVKMKCIELQVNVKDVTIHVTDGLYYDLKFTPEELYKRNKNTYVPDDWYLVRYDDKANVYLVRWYMDAALWFPALMAELDLNASASTSVDYYYQFVTEEEHSFDDASEYVPRKVPFLFDFLFYPDEPVTVLVDEDGNDIQPLQGEA